MEWVGHLVWWTFLLMVYELIRNFLTMAPLLSVIKDQT